MRRLLLLIALLTSSYAFAQPYLTMIVSEGSSGGSTHSSTVTKYSELAERIEATLNRPVRLTASREFEELEKGTKSGQFDIVMIRPSDYAARAIRDYGYRYVANAQPDGQCLFVVRNTSPVKSLTEGKTLKWVLPEESSYMAKVCSAELRDNGIHVKDIGVRYVREQEAVLFYLDNKFADIGAIASYSGKTKQLDKDGYRILHQGKTFPYFPLIVGKRVSGNELASIQNMLANLSSTDDGIKLLQKLGISKFDTNRADQLSALLGWLEK